MKSFTIVHTEWSDGWGGQEMRIIQEAKGITARGHRVIIAARAHCHILSQAKTVGLPTRTLRLRKSFDFASIRELRRLLETESADILNTHSSVDSWIGAIATRLTGTKLLRTRHLSAPVPQHIFNFVYRVPDMVITTGEAVRHRLITHNHLRSDKVLSIPTGVDTSHFTPRPPDLAAKRALGLPDTAPIITIVGILRSIKRHDLFLAAAALLRQQNCDFRFLIVGEGPQRHNIERIIAERHLSDVVLLTGHVDDVRPILSFTDVKVLCSDLEGVPQAVAQALAMARPVVATAVGAVPELVRDQITGLLVPPNNATALAEAVEQMLGDSTLACDCGRRGREHVVQHHSREKMVDQMLELYTRLLA